MKIKSTYFFNIGYLTDACTQELKKVTDTKFQGIVPLAQQAVVALTNHLDSSAQALCGGS